MRRLTLLLALVLSLCGAVLAQTGIAITNGASFQAKFPVAPGSLAAAFPVGGTFAGAQQGQAQALPLPTTLANVQLQIRGTAVPLIFVSANQINFQVPVATPEGNAPVRVLVGGNEVARGTVDILRVSPGVFVLNLADPNQPGAVLNQNSTVNGAGATAARGSVIQIFATGQGATYQGLIPDGTAPGATLKPTTIVPKVYISVREAEVLFSGLSPEFPGLWQLNVRVPTDAFITGITPLFIEYGGILSNTVTIRVTP